MTSPETSREIAAGKTPKKLERILCRTGRHWVGDGFPVRTLFSYPELGPMISPFLSGLRGPCGISADRETRWRWRTSSSRIRDSDDRI